MEVYADPFTLRRSSGSLVSLSEDGFFQAWRGRKRPDARQNRTILAFLGIEEVIHGGQDPIFGLERRSASQQSFRKGTKISYFSRHNLSPVHDHHVVGHAGHNTKIMSHEKHGYAEIVSQIPQDFQDAGLYGNAEPVVGSSARRRSGFVAKDMAIMTRWRMPPENSCG